MIEHQKDFRIGWRSSRPQGHTSFQLRRLLIHAALCLSSAATVHAQTDPWSNAATRMGSVFSGPIVKGFALVAIVVGGLELAFSEGGSKRAIGGLIFGLGMALGAASFISWLFS